MWTAARVALVVVAALALCAELCTAHSAFVWPRPRNPDTGIKEPYPCGNEGFWEPNAPVTDLTPGVVTLYFTENIFHKGAPYRIALSPGDDSHFDEYVLLDHIPHYDDFTGYSYEHGKPFAVNVTIPDIDCPKCALQMLNLMTDKLSYWNARCCTYPHEPQGDEVVEQTVRCFSVYHSCANVRILGSMPVTEYQHTYTGPCGPYGTMEGNTAWSMVNGSFMMNNPNYAPSIINSCQGFQRSCTKRPPPPNPSPKGPSSALSPTTTIIIVACVIAICAVSILGVVLATIMKKKQGPKKY